MIAAKGCLGLYQRMRRTLWSLLALLPGPLMAANAVADDLIDRFATQDTVWSSAIAPDGKHVALGCVHQEVRAVCVYELDKVGTPPRIIPVPSEQQLNKFGWFDSEWLLLQLSRPVYVEWRKFWGHINTLMIGNVRTGPSRLVADLAEPIAIPARGEIVALSPGAITRIDVATGKAGRSEQRNPASVYVWFDSDGKAVLDLHMDREMKNLFAVRGTGNVPVPLDIGILPKELHMLGPFAGDIGDGGDKVSLTGYFEGDSLRYQEFDTRTGKRLPMNPKLPATDVDFLRAKLSREVVGISYVTDIRRQMFFEDALETIRLSAAKALSGQAIEILSWTNDRSAATLTAARPGASETHFLFDRKQGSLSPLGAARPQLAELPTAITTAIEYAARDGLKIEAFLTFPAGKHAADGPFALLVMPRAKALSRDEMRFNWLAEFFAQRGYAVLRPNFRGSAGYGKDFMERGFGEFGGAMIDDITDGVRHLVSSGLADRNRVCAVGVEYGGYASLMIGLREPGLVRCVVAVNAITDPIAMFGETLKYTREPTALHYWTTYLGDRYLDKAVATAISPARSAQFIRVPVLLLQDTQGTFVPASQSRHLKKQMDLYERSAQLREYEGGDVDFILPATRRFLLTQTDAFVAKHLGSNTAVE